MGGAAPHPSRRQREPDGVIRGHLTYEARVGPDFGGDGCCPKQSAEEMAAPLSASPPPHATVGTVTLGRAQWHSTMVRHRANRE